MTTTRLNTARGFTLIELLTVVAILGILAAIAIPQFVLYRQNSFDSMAQSDLRNAVSAEEAYFSSHEAYVSCANAVACMTALHGYVRSDHGVELSIEVTGSGETFTGTARHKNGAGGIWKFESAAGRLIYKQ